MKKCLLVFLLASSGLAPAMVEIPAFTAYSTPDPNKGVNRAKDGNLTQWEKDTSLSWYGHIANKGKLLVSLATVGKAGGTLKLTVSSQAKPAQSWKLDGKEEGESVAFGSVKIAEPGYYRFTLEGRGKLPDLRSLNLDGPASEGAHFSKVERRNSASIHLGYEVPSQAKEEVEWFYLEVTPKTEPLWSYYMATGWHRGYFGMQVNSPTERRIIFSVWDSGNEAIDRGKVHDDNRVKLLAKGPKTNAGDFGNEGTGGHSHLVYPWKLGDTVHFLMRAQAEGDVTIYTGWFRDSKKKDWELVSSFRAPKDGKYLHGLYSFNENFGGQNGQERRVCEFGNGWIKTHSGKWLPLNKAAFTHDGHGKEERLDRSAGTIGKRFYLANGGFVEDTNKTAVTKAYEKMELNGPEGKHPADAELEKLPK
ncbi:DUF3472 domain-containing protein [Luteolibacter sp. GHJ8]|uniref:DUF3472 domain-containing protein n=2 Tax=Luteolibacter rhizosphaerae TaxID=2989719 RepID=A0ABT3GBI8_9BACT|nr:DUF3472 domain-containing protein [Luteolibacter rhizosphaerae]